jgi:hypothetical protein
MQNKAFLDRWRVRRRGACSRKPHKFPALLEKTGCLPMRKPLENKAIVRSTPRA